MTLTQESTSRFVKQESPASMLQVCSFMVEMIEWSTMKTV